MSDTYFGPGTTPERVAQEVERAQRDRDRSGRRAPTTAERERFFQNIAEERKRAEASS